MKILITILFLLFAFIANTQNTFIINYERSIGPPSCEMEGAECIDIAPGGDYIIGGGYYSCNGPVLFRVDNQGVVLWNTEQNPFVHGRFTYVEVTNDDGFLALDDAGYLYKFNLANILLWTLNTGCSAQGGVGNAKLIETNDGYVLTGYSSSGVRLVKVDPNGVSIFSKVYTNPSNVYAGGRGLKQTSDGGYIVSGEYYQQSSSGTLVYLVKTDSVGTFQWAKTYDSPATNDYGTDVLLADDGGYFICDGYNNNGDVCIIKTDSLGTMLWAKSYGIESGSFDAAYYLLKTNDDKIIVAGDANSYFLMKLDTNGNWIWTHKYPPAGGTPTVARQTSDGGFAAVTGIPGATPASLIHCFIKTDSLGDVAGVCPDSSLPAPLIQNITNSYTVTSVPNNGTNNITISPFTPSLSNNPIIRTVYCNVTPLSSETILPDNNVVSIFPNPTTGIFTIQMDNGNTSTINHQPLTIEVYNVLGKLVFQTTVNSKQETVNCDLRSLPSGIYFYKLSTPSPFSSPNGGGQEGAVATGKLIIQ